MAFSKSLREIENEIDASIRALSIWGSAEGFPACQASYACLNLIFRISCSSSVRLTLRPPLGAQLTTGQITCYKPGQITCSQHAAGATLVATAALR